MTQFRIVRLQTNSKDTKEAEKLILESQMAQLLRENQAVSLDNQHLKERVMTLTRDEVLHLALLS